MSVAVTRWTPPRITTESRCARCETGTADHSSIYCRTCCSRWQADRQAATRWARAMLHRGWFGPTACILDTETTGLGPDAEIVEIAVLDMRGKVLLNTLVQPESAIPAAVTAIHGITADLVTNAPRYPMLHARLAALLQGRPVIIYNATFDLRMLIQAHQRHRLPALSLASVNCAMLFWAQHQGSWNRARGSYQWPKLRGGDHTALGDCRATLHIMREMAE